MKITFPPSLPEDFVKICSLAELENKSKLNEYILNHEDEKSPNRSVLNIVSAVALETHQIKISPVWFLAYQSKHKAVKWLLKNGANRSQALFGYALAGEIKAIYDNLRDDDDNDFYYISVFLAYGGHYQHVFSLYDRYITQNPHVGAVIAKGFAAGLGGPGIAQNKQRLIHWLVEHIQFEKHPLLLKLLSSLRDSNIMQFEASSLMKTAASLHLSALFPAAVAWPQLYVWLWQAPRLMQNNKLPMDLFIKIASFLCFKEKEADLLASPIYFIKTKQLLMLSLNSLASAEVKFYELYKAKEKKQYVALMNFFSHIDDCKFGKAVQTEISRRGQNKSQGESSVLALEALKRCHSRLAPLL